MRHVLAWVLVGLPAVAAAQPGSAPPPPPAYGQPQPYAQPYGAPMGPAQLRNGLTFEANLGLGWIHISANGDSDTSDVGLGGLALGVGGWVSPTMAVTLRLAGATIFDSVQGIDVRVTNAFLGPSAQYWLDDHLWLGGGAGLGVYGITVDDGGRSESDSINGFMFDLRAGYTFSQGTESTWNASLELNPGFYSENGDSATLTSVSILLGYQHL